MNIKQADKYQQIKAQLLAISFNWVDAPKYTKAGETVYQSESVFFQPNADELWSLQGTRSGFFCLVRGDESVNLGFILEYNTDAAFLQKQAAEINNKVSVLFQ